MERFLASRWTLLTLIFFARIGVGFQFIAVAALMSQLQNDLQLGYGEIGLLLGSFMFTAIFLSIPNSIVATFLGDRVTLLGGLGALVIGGIILAESSDFSTALIGRLFGGIGAVFITVTGAKVLTDRFAGKEIATAMSFLGVAWPVGIALGLSVLPFATQWQDWRAAVYLTIVLPAVAAVTLSIMPLTPEKASERGGEPASQFWKISRREFRLVILGGLAWTLMSSGGYVVFSSFAPVYLAEQGVTQAEAGLMVSILSWLIIVTIPLGGYLVDRTGQGDKAIWIGCLVAAAAIAMIPVGGPIIVWIVLSAALGITVGAVMALPSEVLSTNSRATGMGVFFTLYYAGTAGLPALAGWLHEITGNVEAVIWFSAVCLVLSPITLLAFRKLQQRMALGI
jgi:predicted MFS family arabinose efflux permease